VNLIKNVIRLILVLLVIFPLMVQLLVSLYLPVVFFLLLYIFGWFNMFMWMIRPYAHVDTGMYWPLDFENRIEGAIVVILWSYTYVAVNLELINQLLFLYPFVFK